jgi:uncharacterized repeat protein (TIGR03803 family)
MKLPIMKTTLRSQRQLSGALMTIIVVLALSLLSVAQTFSVLHTFAGGQAGANPTGTLAIDGGGNIYGTAYTIAYKLSKNHGWAMTPLRTFNGGPDGYELLGGVVFGPDGGLYGTTWVGGFGGLDCPYGGCGIIYKLTPGVTFSRTALTPWTETIVYPFQGTPIDGQNPEYGNLVFTSNDTAYGMTDLGGPGFYGTVFKLTRNGDSWSESMLYGFNGTDGAIAQWGPVVDQSGNIFGATDLGGTYNNGIIFELSPSPGGYTLNTLYNFRGTGDGQGPIGVLLDASGHLFGNTVEGGMWGGGAIFELSHDSGSWTYNQLFSFGEGGMAAPLTMDSAGNLYGTSVFGGSNGAGMVFELSPSGGTWNLNVLYSFTGGTDGSQPKAPVLFDSSGNLYGTTNEGGDLSKCYGYGCGTVWTITR